MKPAPGLFLCRLVPRSGAAHNRAARNTGSAIDAVTAPVAASLAAAASGLNVADGLTGYLFGFAENQVMVLAKALPMGQIAAQSRYLRWLPQPDRWPTRSQRQAH